MTSKKILLGLSARNCVWWKALLCCLIAMGAMGCSGGEKNIQPTEIRSPYAYEKVWAVAPFRNESGTSTADEVRFAEQFSQNLQQVRGIGVVPLNRVMKAMEAHGLASVRTSSEALTLMHALNVDGLVVGTITAWDPYQPPRIGGSVQLFSRRGRLESIDPLLLRRAGTSTAAPFVESDRPVSQVTGHFDSANGSVLTALQFYSTGRTPSDSASGWRRYLLSMDLFSEFVSHALMRRLFDAEWRRMAARPPDVVPSVTSDLPRP